MKRRGKTNVGQSMLELAMMLPILCGLLFLVIKGFRVNHEASDKSIRRHSEALREFNHGNSGAITIDGVPMVPGRLENVVPAGASYSLGDILGSMLPKIGLQLGLNAALSHIPFLDGKTYESGFARGAVSNTGGQLIESGFKKVDATEAAWAGATGLLQSQDAQEDFLKRTFLKDGTVDSKQCSADQLAGSCVLGALDATSQSQGDLSAGVFGAIYGGLNSDTAQVFFENGSEIAKGALKGALSSSIAGIQSGELKFRQVMIGASMGAVNTRTVAKAVSLGYGGADPRNAASFGAANSAFATLINGGKLEDAMYSASSGAFFSGQTMGAMGVNKPLEGIAASTGYQAAIAGIKGEDLAPVGIGAGIAAGSYAIASGVDAAADGLKDLFKDAKAPEQYIDGFETQQSVDAGTALAVTDLDELLNPAPLTSFEGEFAEGDRG